MWLMNFEDWKGSLVEGKNPCYQCVRQGNDNNQDNFHLYSDERGGYCFSCGFKILSDEYREAIQIENEQNNPMEYEYMAGEWSEEIFEQIKESTGLDSKGYRGIRTDISRSLGIRYEYSEEDGSVVKTFYPITKGCMEKDVKKSISGLKVREHPKTFYSIGEVGSDCDMFLQWKFKTHRSLLLITAGEADALAAYQMLYDNHVRRGNSKLYDEVAVISSTVGEGGTAKQLRKHYQWLTQFNKIVVCMDNDDAGRKATEDIVKILPKGKAFTISLRYEDINKYLDNGDEQSFLNDFWGHKPYVPDGIKSSADGFDGIAEELLSPKFTLPKYMHRLQHNMGGGIQQGRIVNIIAATSTGKTTHVNNMVYHWIFNSPEVPTIVTLEATAAQYSLNLLQTHLQENFTFGKSGSEIYEYINTPEVIEARKELMYREDGTPRYYMIDERSGSIKNIEEQIEEMFKKYNSKLIVIDVLSDLLRGSNADLAEDHMNFQKVLVKEGCTIINVLHTVKIPLNSESGKPRDVTEYDALGTGSFVQSAAINLVLNRDKLVDNQIVRNTTSVLMPKCRGGVTGQAGGWYFDFDTFTCYDYDDYIRENPHLFAKE